jgi:hypothetical protein
MKNKIVIIDNEREWNEIVIHTLKFGDNTYFN